MAVRQGSNLLVLRVEVPGLATLKKEVRMNYDTPELEQCSQCGKWTPVDELDGLDMCYSCQELHAEAMVDAAAGL